MKWIRLRLDHQLRFAEVARDHHGVRTGWLEQAMLRFEDEDDERVAVEATINQASHLLVSKIM
jgi:hypothetical protein